MTNFVSIDEAIDTAMSFIEGADAIDRNIFRQWVYLGLRQIGPSKDWIKDATLYADDFTLRKPDDCYKLIDVALFTATNQELSYAYRGAGTRIHSNRKLQTLSTSTRPITNVIDLSEDSYYLHFGTTQDQLGSLVSYAKIKYLQLPVDEDGLPKIPENHVFAIAMFIVWRWTAKDKNNWHLAPQAKADWLEQRNIAKSLNRLPSQLEGTEIARKWMTMLPNFSKLYKSF